MSAVRTREYLIVTPEVTWGTYASAGTHTTLQLTDSNSFTIRPVVMSWEIRSAGGLNRRVQRGSGTLPGGTAKVGITGNLGNMIVYDTQATLWQVMLTPVAGPPVEMPSYTFDHVIQLEDGSGTAALRRYVGCKVSNANFSCTADAQLLRMNLAFVGKTTDGTFTSTTEPVASAYPTGNPFVLENVSGFTLGSIGSRTEFDNFTCTIANVLDGTFWNSNTITRLRFCSRNVDASVTFPYTAVTDRTTDYETVAAHASTVTFTNTAATHTLVFTFEGANYITSVADALDYNRVFMQNLNFANYLDTTVTTYGTDLTITAT